MNPLFKKLGLPTLIASTILATGCTKPLPVISIEVIGDGDVIASQGYSCVDGKLEAVDSEEPVLNFFSTLAGLPECTAGYKGSVTFTAVPGEGQVFYGWGDVCTGTDTCTTSGQSTNAAEGTPVTAFFYPADVATAVDALNIDDVWVRNCIAESMVAEGTTDAASLTTANCLLNHSLVPVETVDLDALLSASPNLENLLLQPRTPIGFLGYLTGGSENDVEAPGLPGLDLSLLNEMGSLSSFEMNRLDAENFDLSSDSLTHLHVSGSNMAALNFLGDLPNLNSLEVLSAPELMTAENFVHITNLNGLTNLALNRNGLSDISPLASLTNLTDLELYGNFELADISPLASLTAIENLDLGSTSVDSLAAIAGMTQLATLSANSSAAELDASVFATSSFANLTELDLSYSGLDDADLAAVATNAFPSLVNLNLTGNPVVDLSVLDPANFPSLEELRLSRIFATDPTPLFGFDMLAILSIGSSPDAPELMDCAYEEQLEAALPNTNVYMSRYTSNGKPGGCQIIEEEGSE